MYKRRLFVAAFVACVTIGGGWAVAVETATIEPIDAATLYLRAAHWITAISPAGSNGGYPPFGAEWDRIAQAAWDSNGAARRFAHEARFSDQATWPTNNKKILYLNLCRALANDLGDAAMYEHLHGNDAGAIETMRDLLHLTAMLRQNPHKGQLVRLLVAGGIDALIANRLLIIDSEVKLTADAGDTHDLQVGIARNLIDELLDQRTPTEQFSQVGLSANGSPLMNAASSKSWMETLARENTERTFAAMSLACHIFWFENHRWPKHLDELVPNYLPHVSVDPWGDGEQTLGYALIKGGLPDGLDRPLVYSRSQSQNGLFYRTDEPKYGFYHGDGSKQPADRQKHGGQFRDVVGWIPGENASAVSTTRPLN